MNLLFVTGLILFSGLAVCKEAGIIEAQKINVIAEDMLYIFKTIYENAKFFDYKDITGTEKTDSVAKSLVMSNIEISTMLLDGNSKNYNFTFDGTAKKISLEAKSPNKNYYTFKFDWRAEVLGIHVSFGTGSANVKAKKIAFGYMPTNSSSFVGTEWELGVVDIVGAGILGYGVKAWVEKNFKTIIIGQLKGALEYNAKFLHTYMNYPIKRLTRRLNDNYTMEYNAYPFDVIKREGEARLIFSYAVYVSLNGQVRFNLTEGIKIKIREPVHDVSIYLAPQFSALTINAHGMVGKCDEVYDMKILGYTNTVRDLFGPMPELATKYNGDEPLVMYCEYAHQGIEELGERKIILPASCSFSVKGVNLLRSTGYIRMTYESRVIDTFLATKMYDISPQRCISKPESPVIISFLMTLYYRLGSKKFGKSVLPMPMIRYVPYREAKLANVTMENGIYVSHYGY